MKTKTVLAFLILLSFCISCSTDKDDNTTTETPRKFGQVGNEWKADFPDGLSTISAKIVSNTNGIVNMEINFDGQVLIYKIKGTITIKGRLNDNSISDFYYSKGDESKPFTLVEFDAEVGDKYFFNLGKTQIEREVIERKKYHISALGKEVETIGVAEYIPEGVFPELFGYNFQIVYWYISPVYGLVCVELLTDEGELIVIEFTSIDI